MKRLFTYCMFSFFLLWQANAQYKPMLVEGNEWNELFTVPEGDLADKYTYILKIEGDTLINGNTYKKILKSTDKQGLEFSFETYMREDIDKQEVYMLSGRNTTEPYKEYLIYKFNLKKGDSFATTQDEGAPIYNIDEVTEVRMHNSNEMRKLYTAWVTSGGYYQWIEGVGGVNGFAQLPHPQPAGGGYAILLCFSQNGETSYKDDKYDSCFIWDMQRFRKILPMADAIWSIQSTRNNYVWNYGIIGDTLIDNTPYKKLYLLSDTLLQIDEKAVYIGALMQDFQRVIMLPAKQEDGTQLDSYLLYNFVTKEGDILNMGKRPDPYIDGPTFENVRPEYFQQEFRVYRDEIGKWGRELHFSADYSEETSWIEGVGSINGLFFGPMRHTTCGSSSGTLLMCLKVKDEIKYLHPECTACFQPKTPGSIDSDKLQANVSVVYRKEAQSIEISIQTISIPLTFSLITLDGRVIEHFTLDDLQTTVNASILPKGIYIYKVMSDEVSASGKFIVN